MSSTPSLPRPQRSYLILFLVVGTSVALLGLGFWQSGMLTFAQPRIAPPAAALPLEETWEAQLAAVRDGRSVRIETSRPLIDDEQLKQVRGLTNLRELIVDRSNITDAGLESLAELPQLEHLRIRDAKITDRAFQKICTLDSLQRLNLPQADLTDEGLSSLGQLARLELLRIGSPRITAIGMQHIAGVKSLRWLHLIDVPVNDAGLQSLAQLKNLESLYLDGAKISDAAYEAFFRDHPDLHVHIDQRHHDRDPHHVTHSH